MNEFLHGAACFLGYVIPMAVIFLTARALVKIPNELFRKILHFILLSQHEFKTPALGFTVRVLRSSDTQKDGYCGACNQNIGTPLFESVYRAVKLAIKEVEVKPDIGHVGYFPLAVVVAGCRFGYTAD